MPGLLEPEAPPKEFRTACTRWASGRATPYDTAVLSSLTTQTPLPHPFDPLPVGFSPQTRLPPAETLHLFHAAKDAARAAVHVSTTRARSEALSASLHEPLSTKPTDFPPGLGAAPARTGLAEAAASAIGAPHAPVWAVPRPALAAAGPGFVAAARRARWDPADDPEAAPGIVTFRAAPDLRDTELVALVAELLQGVERDVVPAGKTAVGGELRLQGAKASGLRLLWLRLRLRFGKRFRLWYPRRRRSSRVG